MDLNVLMQNLKKIRLLNNYTMRYVSDVVGCDQGAYSRWESGESEPKVSHLLKMADLFGMTLDEIANYDPESPQVLQRLNYDKLIYERDHQLKMLEEKQAHLIRELELLRSMDETKTKYLRLLEANFGKKRGGVTSKNKLATENHGA